MIDAKTVWKSIRKNHDEKMSDKESQFHYVASGFMDRDVLLMDLHRRQRRTAIAWWALGIVTGLAVAVTVGSCLFFGWMP